MNAILNFLESTFSKKLLENTTKIINSWSAIHAEKIKIQFDYSNGNYTFESVGTIEEQKYYKKAKKFWAIQNALEDLNNVFIFIEIDRNRILEFYPKIETQEQYFTYHIENFIIRIYTIIDLLGKLGNLLYETEIADDSCNCYNFKEKIKKRNPEIAEVLEDILRYIDTTKKRRHKKLHTGEVEIEELNNITFWEDYAYYLPKNFDFDNPIIKSMNDDQFTKMLENLQSFLDTLVLKINLFLDKSIDNI